MNYSRDRQVLIDYLYKRFNQNHLSNQIRYRHNSEIYMYYFCRRQVLRSLSMQNDTRQCDTSCERRDGSSSSVSRYSIFFSHRVAHSLSRVDDTKYANVKYVRTYVYNCVNIIYYIILRACKLIIVCRSIFCNTI